MGIIGKIFDSVSSRGKALTLYKRGMQKAEDRDLQGAIEDYTAVIEMKRAPPDVTAMALFNRALAYSRSQDDESAKVDIDTVLAMPDAPGQVKEAATEKLYRINRKPGGG